MEYKFSLTKNEEINFPTKIEIDGKEYKINPDYRNILKISKLQRDKNILESEKPLYICRLFFNDVIPPNPFSSVIHYYDFINFYEKEDEKELDDDTEIQFDFEYDAVEIYISFKNEYGINLITVPFLHYYDFIFMLSNLSDNSCFREKIRLRFLDLKDYKGEQLEKLRKAKEKVQLPREFTDEDAEFMGVWGAIG